MAGRHQPGTVAMTDYVTIQRPGNPVRHAAYALMGGKEYETYCGWRWKKHDLELVDEDYTCGNCRTVLNLWYDGRGKREGT